MAKLKSSAPRQKSNVRKLPGSAKPVAKALATTIAQVTALHDLIVAIGDVRAGKRVSLRTSKLMAAGLPKMAQKVVEEAAEVAIEAVLGHRKPLVDEVVDLLYNVFVLLDASGISGTEIWDEMSRRALAMGMAEKLPKIGEDGFDNAANR